MKDIAKQALEWITENKERIEQMWEEQSTIENIVSEAVDEAVDETIEELLVE